MPIFHLSANIISRGKGRSVVAASLLTNMMELFMIIEGTWGHKQRKEYILDKADNKIYDVKKHQYKYKFVPAIDWNNKDNVGLWRTKCEEKRNRYLNRNGFKKEIKDFKDVRAIVADS